MLEEYVIKIPLPVGRQTTANFLFLPADPVSAYWINLNLIRVKNLRSSRGGCR